MPLRAPPTFLRGGSTAFPTAALPPPPRPSISASISRYLPAVILPEAKSSSGLADGMLPAPCSSFARPASPRFSDGRPTKRLRWRCSEPSGDADIIIVPDEALPGAPTPTARLLDSAENLLLRVVWAVGDCKIPKESCFLASTESPPSAPPAPPPPPIAAAPIAVDSAPAVCLLFFLPKVSWLSWGL